MFEPVHSGDSFLMELGSCLPYWTFITIHQCRASSAVKFQLLLSVDWVSQTISVDERWLASPDASRKDDTCNSSVQIGRMEKKQSRDVNVVSANEEAMLRWWFWHRVMEGMIQWLGEMGITITSGIESWFVEIGMRSVSWSRCVWSTNRCTYISHLWCKHHAVITRGTRRGCTVTLTSRSNGCWPSYLSPQSSSLWHA